MLFHDKIWACSNTQIMHSMCMASKTISLSVEAYERLNRNRTGVGDSFSQIVMRAHWEEETVTAAELLERWAITPAIFTEGELDAIESAKSADAAPEDKWNRN